MTDDQVIQAVGLCANAQEDCRKCPLHSVYSANCIKKLMNTTLDLIKRQQAEIERLEAEKDNLIRTYKACMTDAITEFVEKIKERKYQSSDWSHGEHPFVVEEDDIDDVLWKMTEGSNGE